MTRTPPVAERRQLVLNNSLRHAGGVTPPSKRGERAPVALCREPVSVATSVGPGRAPPGRRTRAGRRDPASPFGGRYVPVARCPAADRAGRRDGGPAGPGRKGCCREGCVEETKFRRAVAQRNFPVLRGHAPHPPVPSRADSSFEEGAVMAREGDFYFQNKRKFFKGGLRAPFVSPRKGKGPLATPLRGGAPPPSHPP